MEDLYHYKYLSIKVEELDKQLKDSLAKFKIDFKDYIVNDQNENVKKNQEEDINSDIDSDSIHSGSLSNNNSDIDSDCNPIDDKLDNNISDDEKNNDKNEDENDDNSEKSKDDNSKKEKKETNTDENSAIERKKKKKRRKRKPKAELSDRDKLILRLYRKLSKILHPDKNPSCQNLFLKLKKYYDDKNLIEMVIIADLFDIHIESEEIDNDSYKKDIEELDKKMNNINNNFIWMLYYGTPQQRQIVRQRLMEKLK